ncbi:MAG: FHA domain-containing protein [Lachnospiraceae bacterium]|nr:FHA domain-containing protein [Lachnospiraceae bacterium]
MGNFTFEGQGAYTYLVYQIGENDQIDRLGLGMLTSNKIPGLLPVVYTQMNGQGYVKYNISAKISAKNFFAGAVNRKRLLGVFSGIAEALMSADDYMLDPNSILLDLNYIYADVATCDASLVCVPVISMEMAPVDISGFFKNIMFTAQFDQTENCDYVTRILNYLNSTPLFSLADFKELVDGLRREDVSQPAQPKVVKVQESVKPVVEERPVYVQEEPKVIQPVNVVKEPVNIPAPEPVSGGGASFGGFSGDIPGFEDEVGATREPVKSKGFSLFGSKKKPEKPVVEKKHLFGAKPAAKEKPAKEKPVKKKAVEEPMMGGFSIPGMENVSIPGAPVVEKAPEQKVPERKAANIPVKKQPEVVNVQPVSSYQPQQQAVKMGSGANFGNTVNLSKAGSGKTTMLSKAKKETAIKPYLVRVSNNEQVYLTKALFHIGQEPSYADYCIMDNPAISHAHADVMIEQNMVYLVDTNSTNGSYVNGRELNPNAAVQLNHGDKVTLADEEFVFYLY